MQQRPEEYAEVLRLHSFYVRYGLPIMVEISTSSS